MLAVRGRDSIPRAHKRVNFVWGIYVCGCHLSIDPSLLLHASNTHYQSINLCRPKHGRQQHDAHLHAQLAISNKQQQDSFATHYVSVYCITKHIQYLGKRHQRKELAETLGHRSGTPQSSALQHSSVPTRSAWCYQICQSSKQGEQNS